jgi:hypothetical protein
MKILFIAIAIFCCATVASGQVTLDKNVSLDPSTYNIDVYLQPKSVKGWNDKSNWMVVAIDSSNNAREVDIKDIRPDTANSMFSLIPNDTSSTSPVATAAQLIIKFGAKTVTVYQVPAPSSSASPNGPNLGPASNKQNADLYLSGTYSPAIHSAPQYSIDGSIALMWDLDRKHVNYGQLGVIGSVKTDKRKNVDPDSYRLFLAYQSTPVDKFHGPLQGVLFTWLAAGAEFDRKGKNVNLITAPYLDFPIRLFPKIIRATTEPMAVLTPTIGFEAGHNFHNAVTPDSGRGVFRGVVGADFLFRFNPKLPGFKGIEFTSSYMLRLPAVREIFTLTKTVSGKDVDDPFLSRNPRHFVKSELDFKVTDAFSLAFKHEYGAIPPLFRKEDQKVSLGFTYSIRQLQGGVSTTIRNK